MKKYIQQIATIVLSLLSLPLFFIKFIHEVAILPSQDSEGNFSTIRLDFYYSPFQNLQDTDCTFLFYILIFLILCNISLGILSIIFKDNKKIKLTNLIIFIIIVIYVLLTILFATSMSRSY